MLSDFEKVYYDRLLEQLRNKNRVLFCFFKRKSPITMGDLVQLKDSVDYVLYGPAKSYEDEKLTEKTDVKAEWIVQRNELRKQKLLHYVKGRQIVQESD